MKPIAVTTVTHHSPKSSDRSSLSPKVHDSIFVGFMILLALLLIGGLFILVGNGEAVGDVPTFVGGLVG